MKRTFPVVILICIVLVFSNCGYEEKGHATTPAEYPGSQTRVGVDTLAHPGNIDRDTIHVSQ